MKVKEKKWIRFRIYVVVLFFLLGLGTVLARAFQLQVLEKDHLATVANNGIVGITKLPPKRGTIYDREGHELALSVEVGSVYAHPRQIKDRFAVARQISRVLGEKEKRVLKRLQGKSPFVWVKRRIPSDVAAEVRALRIEGVGVTNETRRYYPGREIGAHLIGFAGTDNQGLEGLERKYDEFLTGPENRLERMRDALGRSFAVKRPIPSGRRMHHLVLTIDKDIQYKAQQALKAAVQKFKARGGHCLVLNPETGEILAMAVIPDFNPNVFSSYKPHQWRNRIITDCFEPGSTIKAFLVAASLEESVVTPQTRLHCEQGKYKVGRHIIHDTHKHGLLTVSDIVVHSSNIGAIKIGRKLGYKRFCRYLKAFGFGSKTGVDLPGEREGFIRDTPKAKEIEKANLSFGQGMTATSLQLATAMAAIANGGKLMRPYVVKQIVDESGHVVEKAAPKTVRRVISHRTAKKTAAILEGVVSDQGTASKAAIYGFRVAGKTGTSQKVDPKTRRYSREKYVATFVGFAPVENPRLVILVVIDEPKGLTYGGLVAGPVFEEVGSWTLSHLRVPPQADLLAGAAVGAVHKESKVEERHAKTPEALAVQQIAKELRKGLLPDFTGLGMREVLRKGRSLGLTVSLKGSGLAYSQVPAPGSPLQKVGKVEVRFKPPT